MNKKVVKKGILPYVVLIIFLTSIMFFADAMNTEVHDITYDKFISEFHITPVEQNVPYWIMNTNKIPAKLNAALIAIVAHSGKFLALYVVLPIALQV